MTCKVCGFERAEIGRFGRRFRQTASLMIGVPDYDTYVAHRQKDHPGKDVMTRAEFFRERQDSRYGIGNGTFRCC